MDQFNNIKKCTFVMVDPKAIKNIFKNITDEVFREFCKTAYSIEVEINKETKEIL